MSAGLLMALAGWALGVAAVAGCLALRRRLELVARAEHELRSPATAFALALEALARDPGLRPHAAALELELSRMRAGLEDLAAARRGRRAPVRRARLDLERLARAAVAGRAATLSGRPARLRWEAGPARPSADEGRVAQALGNLVANAAEHGSGPVELRGRRTPGGVGVEVRNRRPRKQGPREPGRGRGLVIAREAVREAGGRLELREEADGVVASLELPVDDLPPAA